MTIDRALLKASWDTWTSSSLERRGPYWLQWVWTLLFCGALAIAFTVLGFIAYARESPGAWRNLPGWIEWYGRNFVVSLTIGGLIHLLFDASRLTFATPQAVLRWNGWQRSLFFSGLPLVGTAVGWPLGIWLVGARLRAEWPGPQTANTIVGTVLLATLLIFVLNQFFALKKRQLQAERRATEAQLRLLQGQIEPHFLFNTLANVAGLMDHDVTRARLMLESFVDYLRSSLSSLRMAGYTLADELTLVEAYLQIIQIRMDSRLSYRIDVADELRLLPLPALMLQPLVENAIQHGLEPKIEGGCVVISARLVDRRLVITVTDDGLGLDAPANTSRVGTRTALANIRERLAEACGSKASLVIAQGEPRGVQAVLTVPGPA